jgi:HSP20 family molecular chaperone IbpA
MSSSPLTSLSSLLSLTSFNPLQEQMSMMQRLTKFNPKSKAVIPLSDTVDNGANYTVTVELPGIDASDVNVTVEGRLVTVSSKFQSSSEPEVKDAPTPPTESSSTDSSSSSSLPPLCGNPFCGGTVSKGFPSASKSSYKVLKEFYYSTLLADDVDTGHVTASTKNGVLTVTLPKLNRTPAKHTILVSSS